MHRNALEQVKNDAERLTTQRLETDRERLAEAEAEEQALIARGQANAARALGLAQPAEAAPVAEAAPEAPVEEAKEAPADEVKK